jgi:hypothetical protein
MKRKTPEIPSWSIDVPRIRPRSRIFHIKPCGLGTPLIEGLGSHVSRIAGAHHVSLFTFINEVIVPMSKRDCITQMIRKGVTGFYETTRSLNGMEPKAVHLATVLEEITGQSNLLALTIYPWHRLIPSINLLKRHRTWCPTCLSDWRQKGRVIYEPLIWSVDSINICGIHRKPLQQKCPHCSGRVRLANFRLVPGTCSKCGRFLDKECNDVKNASLSPHELTKCQWYWKSVASLLVASCKLIDSNLHQPIWSEKTIPLNKTGVHHAFVKCVDAYYEGNIDLFASSIDTPRDFAWIWYLGYAVPQFEVILAICGQHALDIVSFITKGELVQTNYRDSKLPKIMIPSKTAKSRSIDIASIRYNLSRLMKEKDRNQ